MKKKWMVIGSAVLALSLTGCGANDNAEGNGNKDNHQLQANQESKSRVLRTEQGGLRVDERAEQHVERIKEVEEAHVIISNNDAYVSVRLTNNTDQGNQNGQQKGTGQTGTMGNRIGNENGTNTNGNNQNGNNQSFMQNGTVNQNGDNGIIDGKGDAGNGQSNALGNNNNNGTTNHNTNNANDRNNNGTNEGTNRYSTVSNTFEQRIADQVRKADNKIHRVYVSINPDFHNTMSTYTNDIQSERDRDNLFTDFNNMVTNFFGINNNNNQD